MVEVDRDDPLFVLVALVGCGVLILWLIDTWRWWRKGKVRR